MHVPYRFKVVRDSDAANFDGVRVTLFPGETHVCGWYISPASSSPIGDGYMAKSANLIASSAVLRAIDVAERLKVEVCIIDPEELWDAVWGGF